jgi:hypothetical protein
MPCSIVSTAWIDSLGSKNSKLILCRYLDIGKTSMNRRKKGIQIVKTRIKKAKAKLAPKNKPKYINKAEQAKLAAESIEDAAIVSDS